MTKPELNLSQLIGMILQIESEIKVDCISYGLYDKENKEYITQENCDLNFDYYETFNNKCRFRYTYDTKLKEDVIVYLLKHHGEIYFPMLKKNTQKAYVAQFDTNTLIEKYGVKHNVTPDEYFKNNFCWVSPKKPKKSKSTQCPGQLTLPL